MCQCKEVGFVSYDVSVPVWYDARKRVVGIDYCIVLEVVELWKHDIITIESCCGHNKLLGYISVDDIHVQKMIDLGYKQSKLNCFYTKTK